jgi:hypothetical protein
LYISPITIPDGAAVDRVAVGLRLRRILDRDGTRGADLVLDQDGAAGDWAQFFGEVAGDDVGAAAGRKTGYEMDVRIGIGLRLSRD